MTKKNTKPKEVTQTDIAIAVIKKQRDTVVQSVLDQAANLEIENQILKHKVTQLQNEVEKLKKPKTTVKRKGGKTNADA